MTTSWMEVNSANPVLMTFSSHDVLLVIEVPNLPGAVITSSCNYLLLCMKSHTSNSSWLSLTMCIHLFVHWHSFNYIFKSLRKVWVRSCILWPRSILALNHSCIFNPSAHSLLLHTCIDLLLDLLLMRVNWILEIVNFFLKLIFFKFEQGLFFDSSKMLLLNFFDFFFVVFVQVLHFLYILGNGHFFGVNTILMRLVEVSLLSQFFPGWNWLFGALIGYRELNFELINFLFKLYVFIFAVSYQSEIDIMERSFLLEFVPFRVENVKRLRHFVLS